MVFAISKTTHNWTQSKQFLTKRIAAAQMVAATAFKIRTVRPFFCNIPEWAHACTQFKRRETFMPPCPLPPDHRDIKHVSKKIRKIRQKVVLGNSEITVEKSRHKSAYFDCASYWLGYPQVGNKMHRKSFQIRHLVQIFKAIIKYMNIGLFII